MARFQKAWARLVLCGDGTKKRILPPKTPNDLKKVLEMRSRAEDRGYITPCRIWVGCKDDCGYGVLRYLGKNRKTTRLSWLASTGVDPDKKKEVCHKCDQPSCIEPTHLFLGSHADNMADANSKNRMNRSMGVKHYCCSFTEGQIRELRAKFQSGAKITKSMAAEYGVTPNSLAKIRDFKSWKHIK